MDEKVTLTLVRDSKEDGSWRVRVDYMGFPDFKVRAGSAKEAWLALGDFVYDTLDGHSSVVDAGGLSKKKGAVMKKYRYVVAVDEEVSSEAVIESDELMTHEEIMREAEKRRLAGRLSLCGVTDVTTYMKRIYIDGREARYDEKVYKG